MLSATILSINEEDFQDRVQEMRDYPECFDDPKGDIKLLENLEQGDFDLMADEMFDYIYSSENWSEAMNAAIEALRKAHEVVTS